MEISLPARPSSSKSPFHLLGGARFRPGDSADTAEPQPRNGIAPML